MFRFRPIKCLYKGAIMKMRTFKFALVLGLLFTASSAMADHRTNSRSYDRGYDRSYDRGYDRSQSRSGFSIGFGWSSPSYSYSSSYSNYYPRSSYCSPPVYYYPSYPSYNSTVIVSDRYYSDRSYDTYYYSAPSSSYYYSAPCTSYYYDRYDRR